MRKECYWRVWAIMKTELNSANRIEAINTLAMSVVTYSFNMINWTVFETRRLATKIPKLLTCNRMDHPKADVDRLHISRKEKEGEWHNSNWATKHQLLVNTYLTTAADWMLQLVLAHDKTKAHSISKQR